MISYLTITRANEICWLTPTSRLGLIPLWVLCVHALNHYGALLQRVARVTWEFNQCTHTVGGVAAAEVAVLHKRLITHAFRKSCGHKKYMASNIADKASIIYKQTAWSTCLRIWQLHQWRSLSHLWWTLQTSNVQYWAHPHWANTQPHRSRTKGESLCCCHS